MDSMNMEDEISDRVQVEDAASLSAATSAVRPPELLATDTCRGNTSSLLYMARQFISQGKPSLALQAVVMAMRSEGGEQAVLGTLNRARELYINKLRPNSAVDELASLFAECAIVEARPSPPIATPPPKHVDALDLTSLGGVSETSILAKSGRMQIMLDAFSDGSSFICLKCGGLVSSLRKDEHFMYWCG